MGHLARLSATSRRALWQAQSCLCAGCGKPIENPNCRYRGSWRDMPTLDHVTPLTLGGQPWKGNIVLMHFLCNNMKGDDRPTGCEMIWLAAVNARLGWG